MPVSPPSSPDLLLDHLHDGDDLVVPLGRDALTTSARDLGYL